jgi:hypothetical protein
MDLFIPSRNTARCHPLGSIRWYTAEHEKWHPQVSLNDGTALYSTVQHCQVASRRVPAENHTGLPLSPLSQATQRDETETEIGLKLPMGFYPVAVSPRQYNTQTHISHITYTQVHITN